MLEVFRSPLPSPLRGEGGVRGENVRETRFGGMTEKEKEEEKSFAELFEASP